MFTINGKTNSFYHAFHTHTVIGAPEPKRSTGDVPLADGEVDFTSMLSPIQFYNTREITITMELTSLRSYWATYYSDIMAALHGKKVTSLVFDNDPEHYWTGYAVVEPLEDLGASAQITIIVTADPFKKTVTKTTLYNSTLTGDATITAAVSKMRGYLTFTTGAPNCTVSYDGQTWTLPSGVSTAYGLVLPTGSNTLSLHASGVAIKVEMEEGML